MGKHAHPDPHDVGALAEAVNEVLGPVVTGIVMDGETGRNEDPFAAEVPLRAFEILEQIQDAMQSDSTDPSRIVVVASPRELAFALTLAVGFAVQHEAEERLTGGWIECDYFGELVFYVAQLYVLSIRARGLR